MYRDSRDNFVTISLLQVKDRIFSTCENSIREFNVETNSLQIIADCPLRKTILFDFLDRYLCIRKLSSIFIFDFIQKKYTVEFTFPFPFSKICFYAGNWQKHKMNLLGKFWIATQDGSASIYEIVKKEESIVDLQSVREFKAHCDIITNLESFCGKCWSTSVDGTMKLWDSGMLTSIYISLQAGNCSRKLELFVVFLQSCGRYIWTQDMHGRLLAWNEVIYLLVT